MAWIISDALMKDYENSRCSQGQAAGYSEGNCSDGEQSARSSLTNTQLVYLPQDKMTDFSRLSRFGMMFVHFKESRGEDLLTWYLAGFPAKTSAQPERELESKASDPASGWKWPESSVKYDPATSSWKTRQCSLLGGLDEFSETWPRWGTMRDGECWALPMWERGTKETESGFWPTSRSCSAMAATISPKTAWSEKRNPNLETIVGRRMWPTPNASDNRDRGNLSTPAIQRRIQKGKQITLSMCVSEESGQLNPAWVEWLMGFPLGWTDLGVSATDKYRNAWQKPGEDSEANS